MRLVPEPSPRADAGFLRSPSAIVCCVSAAEIHELTDEMPPAVQITVSKRSHAPVIDHPPVTVFRFDEPTFELGLSSFEAAQGEAVRVYDAARTVVDHLGCGERPMNRPNRNSSARRAYPDLQNRARREKRGTQELLSMYVVERWLARMSRAPYADDFIVKAACCWHPSGADVQPWMPTLSPET